MLSVADASPFAEEILFLCESVFFSLFVNVDMYMRRPVSDRFLFFFVVAESPAYIFGLAHI